MNVLLMYAPPPDHLEALQKAAPGATIDVATDSATAAELIRQATAVLGNRFFLESLPHARRLAWMQSASSGVDRILREGGKHLDGVTVTSARGVYDEEVGDHALALLLALVRRIPEASSLRRREEWERLPLTHLHGRRSLILGWGGVGIAIARRLAACGVAVEGVRRSQGASATGPEGYTIHGPTSWRERLPATDLLVLALPATAATVHLVSHAELAALPPGSLVVNVGRGETLDEEALRAALGEGTVSGAALDVFEQEPLPPGHWLWTDPRVVMTPHWARSVESAPWRWQRLFEENLRRFSRGEALLNVVDHDAGY